MSTLLFSFIMIYTANSQCGSPTFTGVQLKTASSDHADTDHPVEVTIYHDFTIYQCTFEAASSSETYYECTTESSSCCDEVGIYCDPDNDGRLLVENNHKDGINKDGITIDEMVVLRTDNGDDCNVALMNWCMDTTLFDSMKSGGEQQEQATGLTNICVSSETHIGAIQVRHPVVVMGRPGCPACIEIVETSFMEGGVSSRPFEVFDGEDTVESESCNPTGTPTSSPSNPSYSPTQSPSVSEDSSASDSSASDSDENDTR